MTEPVLGRASKLVVVLDYLQATPTWETLSGPRLTVVGSKSKKFSYPGWAG